MIGRPSVARTNSTPKVKHMCNQDIRALGNPDFYNLCNIYRLDFYALLDIAAIAHVDVVVIYEMYLSTPVSFADATSVLIALAQLTGHGWTLDNTRIPVVGISSRKADQ